jgi:peptide deformylase
VSILPIRITGDPVLHQRAQEVAEITDQTRKLIADMFETMDAAPGVGLAAPQVGVSLRIFTYDFEYEEQRLRGVAINPALELFETSAEELSPETESEGCLSVPTERYPLRRASRVKLSALDVEGNSFSLEVQGWMARIFQHEFDHLEGILYVNRLVEPYAEQAQAVIDDYGWGVPGISWLPGETDLDP